MPTRYAFVCRPSCCALLLCSYISAISEVVLDPTETCLGRAKTNMGEARLDILDSEINRECSSSRHHLGPNSLEHLVVLAHAATVPSSLLAKEPGGWCNNQAPLAVNLSRLSPSFPSAFPSATQILVGTTPRVTASLTRSEASARTSPTPRSSTRFR